MLSCRDVTAQASAYLDGDLSRWERLRVLAHVAVCKGCRRYLRQLGTTIAVLQNLPPDTVAGEIVDRLSTLFSEATRNPPPAKKDAPV